MIVFYFPKFSCIIYTIYLIEAVFKIHKKLNKIYFTLTLIFIFSIGLISLDALHNDNSIYNSNIITAYAKSRSKSSRRSSSTSKKSNSSTKTNPPKKSSSNSSNGTSNTAGSNNTSTNSNNYNNTTNNTYNYNRNHGSFFTRGFYFGRSNRFFYRPFYFGTMFSGIINAISFIIFFIVIIFIIRIFIRRRY